MRHPRMASGTGSTALHLPCAEFCVTYKHRFTQLRTCAPGVAGVEKNVAVILRRLSETRNIPSRVVTGASMHTEPARSFISTIGGYGVECVQKSVLNVSLYRCRDNTGFMNEHSASRAWEEAC